MSYQGFGTAAIHVGQEPERWEMMQVVPPISLSSTFKQPKPAEPKGHDYSRAGNPTRDVLQECLAALEGAKKCYTFASGLGATMSLANILKSGDHIICSDDVYGGTNRYFKRVSVPKHGIQLSMVDLTDYDHLREALKENTRMIWFESPSNPCLKVVDIAEVVKVVKAYNKDIIVVVDSTFLSPYFQKPLSLGADVVIHSITKYLNGHSDVVMGCVMTNDDTIAEHLFFMQLAVGAVPSPFDCFLVNRGLKTLHLRMKCHQENGLAVAKFLENDSRVRRVLYPALPSHPQHDIHKKQTTGMSGMVSFYIKGGLAESKKFLEALKVFTLAESLGGYESLAELPVIMTHASVPEDKVFTLAESLGGYESLAELPVIMTHASVPEDERVKLGIDDSLIRLSVGCEDVEDLIKDLDDALTIALSH
uniref:cystathionine gamma-lyase n=1 Tax=Strongyloides papillosus TaxID=174720 RepID=A0A0N5CBH3_STREA